MTGIDGTTISIIGLCLTLIVHLIAFIWWASKLTNRVEHIEKFISTNEKNGERLASIEAKMDVLLMEKVIK